MTDLAALTQALLSEARKAGAEAADALAVSGEALAIDIRSEVQGGSKTKTTSTFLTLGIMSNFFSTSAVNTGPMPQPGAVKVICTPI